MKEEEACKRKKLGTILKTARIQGKRRSMKGERPRGRKKW